MDAPISFGDLNSGLQVGINHGPITVDFLLQPSSDLGDKLPIVHGAAFDSYVNQHGDECLPGTRTDILHEIRQWAFSPQARCLFWLNGMAGTGKSTISRTVAKSLSQAKSLGASFFFKRGEGDRGNALKLFPTLAMQLATAVPQLIPSILKAVHGIPDIATKAMKEQFDKLLLQPLLSLKKSDLPIQTVVIVIDALDECEGDNDVRLILQLLPQLQKSNALRLRVFLTSRPELQIRLEISKLACHDHKDLILHKIPSEAIKHDISLFLNHRLSEIRTERLLPTDWPGDINLQKLVTLSIPLFIFAATICRIFQDPYWDPEDSLTEILTRANDESKLDGTYLSVLDRLLRGQTDKRKKLLVQEFHQVVGPIMILESPLSVISLSRLLGVPERLVRLRLNLLHSVLSVPDEETSPIRLFHLSFRDFLLDPETRQRTPFGVDQKAMNHKLAIKCLLVCHNLRRNICGLPSYGTQRADIDRHTIDHCLSPELQYACQYWAHHLAQCADLNDVIDDAHLFLRRHFLHWVEAMSLLNLASEVMEILDLLQKVVLADQHPAVSDFVHDARRFMLKNLLIADEAPLQLYCSGLIFAPQAAIIRREFGAELPSWISRLPNVDQRWSAELQTLEGHSDLVWSVAFSPDGQLLASSSSDKTIRLWNTAKMMLRHTLEGHSGAVLSVAFSPDGQLLASSSYDKTVRLWELATGTLQLTLEGSSGPVQSVAFSPDGQLASGSDDRTVRLWNSAAGTLQHTLLGHSGRVKCVAFSPNGRLLASGSDDRTIRLWNTARGTLQRTLEDHSIWVQSSVAFSSDSRLLASSSNDNTVRLWDLATGVLQHILEGHSGWVLSVVFSPNSQLLASVSGDHASGSDDKSIRLWDTATGKLRQILEGHSSWVRSVDFSPDGQLLASGSGDATVRLWDLATGTLQETRDSSSYLGSILEMAFSPDGQTLASGYDGSGDKAVLLWNTATGTLRQKLEGHLGAVLAVTFSPDSRLLLSSSTDKTVRLWDTLTGTLQRTWTVEAIITNLEFPQDEPLPGTNSGALDIQPRCDSPRPSSHHVSPEISIDHGQWIKLNGEKVLWLPIEFRPSCYAIDGSLIALGHASRQLSFIEFKM